MSAAGAGQDETVLARFLARVAGERTRENYQRDLGPWSRWLRGRGTGLLEAGRQDVEEYLAAHPAWAPATVCTVVDHVHGLYRWCLEEGLVGADPTALVRRPRRPRHCGRAWLGPRDLTRLLEASLDWRGGGLAAHAHLWGLSGLRPGEPRGLRVADLAAYDGQVTLTVTATKEAGRETLLLPASTGRILTGAAAGRGRQDLLLPHPTTGRAWTAGTERNWLVGLCGYAGVPVVTPYGLRDGQITIALMAGIPEREVSVSARHATTATTSHYDRLRTQVARAVGPRLETYLRTGTLDHEPPHQAGE